MISPEVNSFMLYVVLVEETTAVVSVFQKALLKWRAQKKAWEQVVGQVLSWEIKWADLGSSYACFCGLTASAMK